MPKTLLRSLVLLLPLLCLAPLSAGAAEPDPQIARIAAMSLAEADQFITVVTASVGQDSLKLRGAAERGDCLELLRASNSFDIAYGYEETAASLARAGTGNQALSLRAKVVQARVLTFAARVRAGELIEQVCRNFTVPADEASDPRYRLPARLADAEFTAAIIEAREAAEANLAGAIAAGNSRQCPAVVSAIQSIQLFVPYLEKLLNDTVSRPQALGPRASRRGLTQVRAQLITAANQLNRQFTPVCAAPAAPAGSDASPTPEGSAPADAAPVSP